MSQGYAPSYEVKELEKIEDDMASLSKDLANRIADTVLPQRGDWLDKFGPKCQRMNSEFE
jgi:hypothetical protein